MYVKLDLLLFRSKNSNLQTDLNETTALQNSASQTKKYSQDAHSCRL